MRTSLALLCLALAPCAASAATYHFGGDTTPDSATYGPTFTTIVFGGTSWSSDGDVTTLATAPGAGIWFGAGYAYGDNPIWFISNNATGNSLSLRAAFGQNATDWSAYLADGSYWANWEFDHDNVTFTHAGGTTTLLLDATSFHVYDFYLKDGTVVYVIDGNIVYHGAAGISLGNIALVGDGSGSTPTGTGNMQIDYATFNDVTELPSAVPEPGTAALLTSAAAVLFLARRKRA